MRVKFYKNIKFWLFQKIKKSHNKTVNFAIRKFEIENFEHLRRRFEVENFELITVKSYKLKIMS